MNEFEKQTLELLVELQNAVDSVRTANPKPNLGSILARLDGLTLKLPKEANPQLRHYLQNKSYQKARIFLEGRDAENARGACGHG